MNAKAVVTLPKGSRRRRRTTKSRFFRALSKGKRAFGPKSSIVLLTIGGIILVGLLSRVWLNDDQRVEFGAAMTPQRFAELSLHDLKAAPKVTNNNGAFLIMYNVDPWEMSAHTTRSTNLSFAQQVVPGLFNKFPEARTVEIVVMGKFKDLRGNETRGKVSDLTFSRSNADKIRFENITFNNIPLIADSYWEDPSLSTP